MMLVGNRRFFLCCKIILLLLLGDVYAGVTATVGSDVMLMCTYDVNYHGRLYACWGLGTLPFFDCGNELIETDGTLVTSRQSERYQLLGNLGRGDVSLTIRQVQESDSGTYGCRVYTYSLFDDQQEHTTLTVVPVRPSPPEVSTSKVNDRTVNVAWTPGFNGGRTITRYIIEIKEERLSWSSAKRREVLSSSQTDLILMNLRPAKTYKLRIFAVNSVGQSDASNVLTVTTKEAAPEGPPLDVQLESLSPNSIRVSWKAPLPELRNGRILTYNISNREMDPMGKPVTGWRHERIMASRNAQSVTLSNLKPSTKYDVVVRAVTSAGPGPGGTAPLCSTLDQVVTSAPVLATNSTTAPVTALVDSSTQADVYATVWGENTTTAEQLSGVPPDPPVLELKEAKGKTISIAWTPAAFEGDSPITGFHLESKTTNASWDNTKMVVDFCANWTEATLVELNPATYNIRMFAESVVGTSNASNVLTVTTGDADLLSGDLWTTVPSTVEATASAGEGKSDLLVGWMVPTVLLVLVLVLVLASAVLIALKLRRTRQEKEDTELDVVQP